jgi:prepilin-type N-terminal cleavage/methylation domain-containing protein
MCVVKKVNYKAYTLAEVLITLMVIGVVAAFTIPSLIINLDNAHNVVKLRKAYSVLSQAFSSLKADGGGDISYVFSASDNGTTAMNYFANKLNLAKNCGAEMGCWYDTPLYYLNGDVIAPKLDTHWSGQYGKALLADGTMIIIWYREGYGCTGSWVDGTGPLAGNNICGNIQIDINGARDPNTSGRDYFIFRITEAGIYPSGLYDGLTCDPTQATWDKNDGCSGKVLKEGAMNY